MIEVRHAGPEDAKAVAQLHARSWRESYRGSFTDAFLDGDLPGERLAVWNERLRSPPANQLVLLAMDAADLRGFVCAYGEHDPQWGSLIDNLHVVREAKRSGVGSALMRQVGAWLDLNHPGVGVHLWVLEANTSARRFYHRLGAHDAGVTVMEGHGGATLRSCRYTWPDGDSLCNA